MKKVAYSFKKAILGIFALIFLLTFTLRVQSEQVLLTNSISVKSKASLVHLASVDSLEITEGGIQAATLMLDALENNNLASAQKAIPLYDQLIPKENFGGDYTALQWFAQYLIASPNEQKQLISDKYVASYFQMLAEDNFFNLKEYIQRKYKLAKFNDRFSESGRNREAFLEDFIRFNGPRRENWEKSSQIVQSLNLKKGDRVADIGSGPGYYSFKFAELVGDKGQVFAIDTVQNHLDYIRMVAGTTGMLFFGMATRRLGGWFVPFKDTKLVGFFLLSVSVVTFGGFWLSHVAIKYVDVAIANTLNSTEPLFVLPLAAIFLKEKITGRAIVGAIITMAGIVLLCTN